MAQIKTTIELFDNLALLTLDQQGPVTGDSRLSPTANLIARIDLGELFVTEFEAAVSRLVRSGQVIFDRFDGGGRQLRLARRLTEATRERMRQYVKTWYDTYEAGTDGA